MSLITTPLNTAESYCSVTDADTYHAARGATAWAALTTAQKEQALRKATEYIEGEYLGRWSGDRVESSQTLALPRVAMPVQDYGNGNTFYPSDSIPVGVVRACAELALKSTVADLAPDIERAKTRVKADVIEVEYSEFSSQVTTYRAIDALIRPYLLLGANGGIVKVLRS